MDKGGEILAELLNYYPKLEYLSIRWNHFGDHTFKKFSLSYSLLTKPTIILRFEKIQNRYYDIFSMIKKQKDDYPQTFRNII